MYCSYSKIFQWRRHCFDLSFFEHEFKNWTRKSYSCLARLLDKGYVFLLPPWNNVLVTTRNRGFLTFWLTYFFFTMSTPQRSTSWKWQIFCIESFDYVRVHICGSLLYIKCIIMYELTQYIYNVLYIKCMIMYELTQYIYIVLYIKCMIMYELMQYIYNVLYIKCMIMYELTQYI